MLLLDTTQNPPPCIEIEEENLYDEKNKQNLKKT